MEFTYLYQPPNRFTFQQPKLRKWVESWCRGKVLNLFAGRTMLCVDEYRVDSNPAMKSDWCGDALEFLKNTNLKFQSVILDPPYTLRHAINKYEGHFIGGLKRLKDLVPRVLLPSARVISLGYDSVGMSKSRGFKKLALCLVCHSGAYRDTITIVEEHID